MQAGRMRHTARLQRKSLTPDGQGGLSIDWVDIAVDVPVQVMAVGGNEAFHNQQLQYTNSYRVSMRYIDAFTPAQRIVWEDAGTDRILDVLSAINPDGRKRELSMTCIERFPGPGPS